MIAVMAAILKYFYEVVNAVYIKKALAKSLLNVKGKRPGLLF
jgi:hypothetical protein